MATKYVYAKASATAGRDGHISRVTKGEVWRADDPLVLANPDLFSDEPTKVAASVSNRALVEQATAAPGEVRNVKRSK